MSAIRGVIGGVAIAALISSCIVRTFTTGPRLTGTCGGACDHYVECKAGHLQTDRVRCTSECPQVFSDRDSLMAYESLACKDAVEFIDGTSPRAAAAKHP